MAFGRQCLHYQHHGERVFGWVLVPRLEWMYLNADDDDPHWVERGQHELPGLMKQLEVPTAVLSARDLYVLQSAPFGRISPKVPQSMRIFSAAAARDLGGDSYDDLSTQLGYTEDRAARRAVQHGRKRWARLGAWPWSHWNDGKPPRGTWWTDPCVFRSLELWLADAERVALADRHQQVRWYRVVGQSGQRTQQGYRQTFKNVTPPPKYNTSITSAVSESIYVPPKPEDWSSF